MWVGNGIGIGTSPPGGVRPPWTPANLGTAAALWLSADTGVTHAAGVVSNWDDQSTNNYQFAQATEANKPLYSATGLNANRPAVTADGVNDFLRTSTAFAPIAGGFTLFAVFDNWSAGVLMRDAGLNATQLSTGGTAYTLTGAGSSNVSVVGATTNPHILMFTGLSSANTRINGGTGVNFGDSSTGTLGSPTIAMDLFSTGGTNPTNCALADLIIASTMTLDDIQRLEGWSAHKNGIASLLPSGHPYKNAAPTL